MGEAVTKDTVYRALEVVIDPLQKTITCNGNAIPLRARSFHVLVYLLEQRHRLVSKEELLLQIWRGTTVTDATLVGCIQEIRRALDDNTKTPKFIRTAPRLGYQFVAPMTESPALTAAVSPAAPAARKPNYALIAALAAVSLAAGGLLLYARRQKPAASEPPYFEAAWWKFDADSGGKVIDATISHLDGEAHPSVRWEQGVMGNAILLDGVAAVVAGSGPRSLLPAPDAPRTLMGWIKTSSTNGDDTVIVNETTGTNPQISRDNFQLILRRDGRLSWAAHRLSPAASVTGTTRVDDGQWHHVAGVYGGSPQRVAVLYVDGLEEAAGALQLEINEQPGTEVRWSIANGVHRWTPFRGSIDDVRIYSRALRPSEIAAMHRCVTDKPDIRIAGMGIHYFLPLIDTGGERLRLAVQFEGPDGGATSFRNIGLDFAGIQVTKRRDDCALRPLRGADLGQDLTMSVELLVPSDAQRRETQAGPYFRSRRAAPGDGIQGGTSAGYWVRLHSTGVVTVRRLNPITTIAFTQPARGFDPNIFHKLEVAAYGDELEASLDGKLLVFDQAGITTSKVRIPSTWKGPPEVGYNHGAAGVLFASEGNRHLIGGQQARRLQVSRHRPLQ